MIQKAAEETLHAEGNILYNAPVLVVVSASNEQKFPNIQYANAACILENMLLAASDRGIDSVYIWGATVGLAGNRELWEKLGVPEGYLPVSGAVFGYGVGEKSEDKELKISLAINYA